MSEKAIRERKTVYDEITSDTTRPPMQFEELRQRLKHIAGLCWGLSIDLNNEISRCNQLTEENKRLNDEITGLKDELRLLRWRQNSRDRAREKARATIEAEQNGDQPAAPVPAKEPRKKGVNKKKLATEQARAKRKAEFEALPEKERERRLKKRMYQQRYMEKKRAEQAQGGDDGSNQN